MCDLCIQLLIYHPINKTTPPSTEKVQYDQWKHVTLDNGRKKMKIVSAEVKKEKFKDLMKNDLSNFRQHAQREEAQYS